jgi:hypothetical protein
MNTPYNPSVAHNREQKTAHTRSARAQKYLPAVGMILVIALSLSLYLFHLPLQTTRATGPDLDAPAFYALASNGQGDVAVQQLAALAAARGGWGPAPGDEVVYDAQLRPALRASTQISDYADDCEWSKFDRPGPGCHTDFQTQQFQVRFGFFTFANETANGVTVPRPVDDMLSVYIEEVGHSWQEYLYETEGRGSGERTRLIAAFESQYWAAGWEYQVKRYILSLNGTWLSLSKTERREIKASICKKDGYANPTNHVVQAYGPPPGWPNPAGWRTVAPTPQELRAFCRGT